jgi:hypothetical protein
MSGSGFKTFTAGAVLTASDVNSYLMEQSVMYFATTAARDAAVTGVDGMIAYIGSGDSNEGLYHHNGTAWCKGPGWNAPWGVMGHFSTTSNSDDKTNETFSEMQISAANSFRLTVATRANRRLRFTFRGSLSSTNGGGIIEVYNNTTSASIGRVFQQNDVLGAGLHADGSIVATSSASSTVYTIRWRSVFGIGGAGTFSCSGSVSPTQFTIEDIGPSGNPA